MLFEGHRMDWRFGMWAGLTLAVVTGTALGSLAGARARVTSPEGPRLTRDAHEASLSRLLLSVDAALARKDLSRAIYEWRNAYGQALRTHGWEAMAAVGDTAVRIDALAALPGAHPTGFRAEARQAYLLALFRARAASLPEGIERVAQAFTALGDAEMAARVRSIQVKVAR